MALSGAGLQLLGDRICTGDNVSQKQEVSSFLLRIIRVGLFLVYQARLVMACRTFDCCVSCSHGEAYKERIGKRHKNRFLSSYEPCPEIFCAASLPCDL